MIGHDLQQNVQQLEQRFPEQPLDLSVNSIENWLYMQMYSDFQMLQRACNGHEYRFLKHAIHWFELFNLKMLIRGKFSGVSESALSEQLIDVGELEELPLQKLIQTDDPFEMFRLLEQTSYAGIVRQARRVFEEQGQELFSLDSALDRNFFLELVGLANFLPSLDRQQLKVVFGALLDAPFVFRGLTGRKIIVDTYGGQGSHGGGCFSGKDPSKVDRSASYMGRHIAKNIVAAGLAKKCEIQIAYAIGVAEPVSVMVDLMGTGTIAKTKVEELVTEVFDLRPAAIIEHLDLLRPIYRKTAAYGHFGRNEPEFSWENTDIAEMLKEKAGL